MNFNLDELMNLYEACATMWSQASNIGDKTKAEEYKKLKEKIQEYLRRSKYE